MFGKVFRLLKNATQVTDYTCEMTLIQELAPVLALRNHIGNNIEKTRFEVFFLQLLPNTSKYLLSHGRTT